MSSTTLEGTGLPPSDPCFIINNGSRVILPTSTGEEGREGKEAAAPQEEEKEEKEEEEKEEEERVEQY